MCGLFPSIPIFFGGEVGGEGGRGVNEKQGMPEILRKSIDSLF